MFLKTHLKRIFFFLFVWAHHHGHEVHDLSITTIITLLLQREKKNVFFIWGFIILFGYSVEYVLSFSVKKKKVVFAINFWSGNCCCAAYVFFFLYQVLCTISSITSAARPPPSSIFTCTFSHALSHRVFSSTLLPLYFTFFSLSVFLTEIIIKNRPFP